MAGPYTGVAELQQQIRALEVELMRGKSGEEYQAIKDQIAALKKQIAFITTLSGGSK